MSDKCSACGLRDGVHVFMCSHDPIAMRLRFLASQIPAEVRDNASSLSNTQSAQDGKAVALIEELKLAADMIGDDEMGEEDSLSLLLLKAVAGLRKSAATVEALRAELNESDAVIERLSRILAEVAIALKGPELPLSRHSYHDLGEVAQVMKLELDICRHELAASQQRVREYSSRCSELEGALSEQKKNLLTEFTHRAQALCDKQGGHNVTWPEFTQLFVDLVGPPSPAPAASAERVAELYMSALVEIAKLTGDTRSSAIAQAALLRAAIAKQEGERE